MSRPPLGCMVCTEVAVIGVGGDFGGGGATVSLDPSGAYWTLDKNFARWDVYLQPGGMSWSAYSTQYGNTAPLQHGDTESEIWVKIAQWAATHGPYSPVPLSSGINPSAPYKSIPSSPTYGPPSPPAGWTPPVNADGLPPVYGPPAPPPGWVPPVTPATPVSPAVPVKPAEPEKSSTGPLVMLGVGAVAILLVMGTLKVK